MPIADLPSLPKGSGASLLFHLSMEEEGQEERILEEGRRKEGRIGRCKLIRSWNSVSLFIRRFVIDPRSIKSRSWPVIGKKRTSNKGN